MSSSSKEKKSVLLQLIATYNQLSIWNVPDSYRKGIDYIAQTRKDFSLSQEEEWNLKKMEASFIGRKGNQEGYFNLYLELLGEHRKAYRTPDIIEDLCVIASHFERTENQLQALPLYEEAYQLAKSKQLHEQQNQCLFYLITALHHTKHYARTIAYCDSIKGTPMYHQKPIIKKILADCYLHTHQPDSARLYLKSDQGSPAILNLQMADSYIIENKEDSAMFYIAQATRLFKRKNIKSFFLPPHFMPTYSSLARLQVKNGKFQEAGRTYALIEPLMRAEVSTPKELELQISALTDFSTFCRSTKQYEKAVELFAYRDSIQLIYNGIQKKRETKNLADQYKIQELTHKLELNEATLNNIHRLLVFSLTSSIIVAFIGAILFILYRKVSKQNKALYQQSEKLQQPEKTFIRQEDYSPEQIIYQKACKLVSEHRLFLDDKMSCEKLAEMLDTNRTYLSKAINVCMGENYSFWMNNYRLEYAIKIMHSNTSIKLKELASLSGFKSIDTFNRNFEKKCGITPREYLKQIIIEQHTRQAVGVASPMPSLSKASIP